MRIVGIMLARDEDLFVEHAIRNAIDFCDEFLVADHRSRDRTPEILSRLAAEFSGKLQVRDISHPRESHEWIRAFADTSTWVFGVDGDEIYDPAGLQVLRGRLAAGEFHDDWCLFGNVLNVRQFHPENGTAVGHLAPPCRSMTKLYNFRLISDWHGRGCIERLHGGQIDFHLGYDDSRRCDLYKETSWEDAAFRCLHLCFLRRSSREAPDQSPRPNIMDRHAWTLEKVVRKLRALWTGQPALDWKEQRYGRGPKVEKSFAPFFPQGLPSAP